MNIFNLFGQEKPKNDPYWEFDQTKHFRPKLNKGDFFKLTGSDFCWFVLEPISDYIQDRKGELTKGKTCILTRGLGAVQFRLTVMF